MNRRQFLAGLGAVGGAAALVASPAAAAPVLPLPERGPAADLLNDLLYRGEPATEVAQFGFCYWDEWGRRICSYPAPPPPPPPPRRRRRRRRVCWWERGRRVCVWRYERRRLRP